MRMLGASSAIPIIQLLLVTFTASLPSVRFPSAVPVATEFGVDHNLTLPLNITALKALPRDPYTYNIPNSNGLTVKFSSFGPRLNKGNAIDCFLEAQEDIIDHLNIVSGINEPVGTRELQYGVEVVFLRLSPTRSLTWGMWANAVRGSFRFVSTWGAVEMVFEIQMPGFEEAVGRGRWSSSQV